MSQTGAGLLLFLLVGPVLMISAYAGWMTGRVRLGIVTHERREESLFYWWGMVFNTFGGVW